MEHFKLCSLLKFIQMCYMFTCSNFQQIKFLFKCDIRECIFLDINIEGEIYILNALKIYLIIYNIFSKI